MGTHTGRCFHFPGKKYSKMMLKINLSVETPLHLLSMGMVHLQIMSSCFSGKINWKYFKVVNIDVTIATEF